MRSSFPLWASVPKGIHPYPVQRIYHIIYFSNWYGKLTFNGKNKLMTVVKKAEKFGVGTKSLDVLLKA